MALLLIPLPGAAPNWVQEFKRQAPDLDVRVWPEFGKAEDVEFAAVHFPKGADLNQFRNLKFIASLFAGVDHLLVAPEVPKSVTLVRASDPKGDHFMNETALLHVLRHHRHLHEYAIDQRNREWKPRRPVKPVGTRKVGVMGLGQIGLPVAQYLRAFGFDVAGWARTKREVPGITVFAGPGELAAFLARSEILVNLLAVTPETENILNARNFAQMPKGACVVNLARGQHVVEADLMAALDSGQLSGATLDVFRIEPLPKDDPLWGHPRVSIMPHVARSPHPRDIVPQLLENIRRARAGQPLAWIIDRKVGY